MMEVWLNLMNEAMHGGGEARDVMRSITGTSLTPDQMLRIMTRFMPAGVGTVQAKAFNESLEEYWRMMGVVPRYRYLDLLERYEQLRLRLEENEKASRQLPMMSAGQPEEAQKVFGLWSSMMEETLKAQQELMKSWTPQNAEGTEGQAEGTSKPADTKSSKSGGQ
jgi:hypothetical protein